MYLGAHGPLMHKKKDGTEMLWLGPARVRTYVHCLLAHSSVVPTQSSSSLTSLLYPHQPHLPTHSLLCPLAHSLLPQVLREHLHCELPAEVAYRGSAEMDDLTLASIAAAW
jgi:hypothetical protein